MSINPGYFYSPVSSAYTGILSSNPIGTGLATNPSLFGNTTRQGASGDQFTRTTQPAPQVTNVPQNENFFTKGVQEVKDYFKNDFKDDLKEEAKDYATKTVNGYIDAFTGIPGTVSLYNQFQGERDKGNTIDQSLVNVGAKTYAGALLSPVSAVGSMFKSTGKTLEKVGDKLNMEGLEKFGNSLSTVGKTISDFSGKVVDGIKNGISKTYEAVKDGVKSLFGIDKKDEKVKEDEKVKDEKKDEKDVKTQEAKQDQQAKDAKQAEDKEAAEKAEQEAKEAEEESKSKDENVDDAPANTTSDTITNSTSTDSTNSSSDSSSSDSSSSDSGSSDSSSSDSSSSDSGSSDSGSN